MIIIESWYSSKELINCAFFFSFFILGGIIYSIQCSFIMKLINKPFKKRYFIIYLLTMYLFSYLNIYLELPWILMQIIDLGIMFLFIKIILSCSFSTSVMSVLIDRTILEVGVMLSEPVSYFMIQYCNILLINMIASQLFLIGSLLFVTSICWYFVKQFSLKLMIINKNTIIFLVPFVLILCFLEFIYFTGYSVMIATEKGTVMVNRLYNDYQVLFLISLTFLCVIVLLISYKRIIEYFMEEKKKMVLVQQMNFQKNYIQKVKFCYQQTKAFRHDIKNHILVLNGLFQKGYIDKAIQYVKKMEKITALCMLDCNTGNLIVDALLNQKLGEALQEGIKVNCDIQIPAEICIDDVDLCIVFGNIIDNAVNACKKIENEEKYIFLHTVQKNEMFIISVENSIRKEEGKKHKIGLGLNNIKSAVTKYNGMVNIEELEYKFIINILFSISLH